MVRIIGNSVERVPIPDLGDVVYYRQIKDYTDQDYERSKDLNREVAKGRLMVLENHASAKGGSGEVPQPVNGSGVSLSDLKQALKEHVPQVDIKGALRDLAPMIADVVRQEVSRAGVMGTAAAVSGVKLTFVETGYVPTVSTEGMVSNIAAKETAVDGSGTDDTLKLLRQMQKGSQ